MSEAQMGQSFLNSAELTTPIFLSLESLQQQSPYAQTFTPVLNSSNSSIQNQIQRLQKSKKRRNKAMLWDVIEQLYYFDSVLRFVIENPYLTVSWAQWKPTQYYNFIAEKMRENYPQKARTANQIKTKDQNLKKHYHNQDKNGCKKMDIVGLALGKIKIFVSRSKKFNLREQTLATQVKKNFERFDQTLQRYEEFLAEMAKPKAYQTQLTCLVDFLLHQQDKVNQMVSVETRDLSLLLKESKDSPKSYLD